MSVLSAPQISAVLIVKNEEAVLDECLQALHWVDEIVVYDTGSTDSTREIAARHTPHVIEGYWDDDFGGARNRALEHATGEWVLTVDADEVFVGDADRLRRSLDPRAGSFMIVVDSLSSIQHQSLATPSIRVFLRGAFRWAGRLHEQMVPAAPGYDPTRSRPLPNVRLVHSGYLQSQFDAHDKGNRNLTIARREVDMAIAEGRSPEEFAVLQANLARSLGFAGRTAEALTLAQEALATELLPAASIVQLVKPMVDFARGLGKEATADAMLALWLEHAPHSAWPLAHQAVVLAGRDDALGVLDVLDRIPTTVVDSQQVRFVKHELADVEVWALMRAERFKDAARVALRAVGAGYASLAPYLLTEIFARAGVPLAEYVRAIPDTLWTSLAMQATSNPVRSSRVFLDEMARRCPGDTVILTCVSVLSATFSLEEAAAWAIELRAHGMAHECPLVAIALDESADPRQRALAGAMAVDIYADERAMPGLESALALVPPEQEAEVLSYLEVVAPGLISRS